jgi:ATP-dependent protease Clp ATPase subunit
MDPRYREKSILVLDEFDKLLETKMSGDMNVSETVQSELLRLFDHDILFFGADRNDEKSLAVDCKNVSCVLLGAFDNLMKAKAKAPVSMGFGGTPKKTTVGYDTTEVSYSDLQAYTQVRDEILGRLERIVCLKQLSVHDHIRILLNYVDNLSKKTGCNITIDLATLHGIASKAVTMPFGARWAKARVSALLDEMVYENPFETNYVYCPDTERTVTAHAKRDVDPPY